MEVNSNSFDDEDNLLVQLNEQQDDPINIKHDPQTFEEQLIQAKQKPQIKSINNEDEVLTTHKNSLTSEWMKDRSLKRLQASKQMHAKLLLKEWREESLYGQLLDVLQVIFSVLTVVMYVWQTYLEEEPKWMRVANTLFAVLFAFDYLQNFYLAPNKWRYLYGWYQIIDLITIIPVFVRDFPQFAFLRILRTFGAFRILRLLKNTKQFNIQINAVQKQAFIVVLSIFCLIFITAGFLNAVETDPNTGLRYQFQTSLYCVIVTIATVGYGDVTPKTEIGRVIIMTLMVSGAIIIPIQLNKLATVLSQHSAYDSSYNKSARHVILSGNVSPSSLKDFLTSFYLKDRGQMHTKIVILQPGTPSQDLVSIIKLPKFEKKVQYLRGSCMLDQDLLRANADRAKGCFLLSNPHSLNHDESDQEIMLKTLSIRKFNPKLPIFCQLNTPTNRDHVVKIGVKQSFSVSELKMNLMAKTILYPGIITFICNLVQNSIYKKINVTAAKHLNWEEEYLYGRAHDIYTIKLPKAFVNKTFRECAIIVYTRWNALLFGVKMNQKVSLNPGDRYQIKENDIAFVMALDTATAREISVYQEKNSSILEQVTVAITEVAEAAVPQHVIHENPSPEKQQSNFYKSSDMVHSGSGIHLHLSASLRDLKSAVVQDVYKDIPDLGRHILVCGGIEELYYFIKPLRSRLLDNYSLKDIVILTSKLPTDDQWHQLSKFSRVYFVEGSSLHWSDLVRSGIDTAHSVVILAESSHVEGGEIYDIDCTAILTYLTIQANMKSKNSKLLIELVIDGNAKFLSNDLKTYEQVEGDLLPAYAAGKVYLGSLLDSLLAKAYLNPNVIEIITLWSQILDSRQLASSDIPQSNLVLIDVPPTSVNRSFFDLFYTLIQKNILPLGLFRAASLGSSLPYIFTCPLPTSVVSLHDKVIVLELCTVESNH